MIHRTMTRRTLETLVFDNTYARLPEAFYAKLNPTPFQAAPCLVHANPEAARRAFVYFKAVIEVLARRGRHPASGAGVSMTLVKTGGKAHWEIMPGM